MNSKPISIWLPVPSAAPHLWASGRRRMHCCSPTNACAPSSWRRRARPASIPIGSVSHGRSASSMPRCSSSPASHRRHGPRCSPISGRRSRAPPSPAGTGGPTPASSVASRASTASAPIPRAGSSLSYPSLSEFTLFVPLKSTVLPTRGDATGLDGSDFIQDSATIVSPSPLEGNAERCAAKPGVGG